MTANELVALRQRAERAARQGGVVAVDARTLLRLLDAATQSVTIVDAMTAVVEGVGRSATEENVKVYDDVDQ